MTGPPAEKLAAEPADLQPLLARSGFAGVDREAGSGSGGPFVSATFAKGDRELRAWLRGDSLSVAYRIASQTLDHATFPRDDFRRCAAAAQHEKQLTGAQRLARIEQQLKRG